MWRPPAGCCAGAKHAIDPRRIPDRIELGPVMSYVRPELDVPIPAAQKTELLSEYVRHYAALARADQSTLRRKVANQKFADLLDKIGDLIIAESARLAKEPGPVRTFTRGEPGPSWHGSFPDGLRSCVLPGPQRTKAVGEQRTDRYGRVLAWKECPPALPIRCQPMHIDGRLSRFGRRTPPSCSRWQTAPSSKQERTRATRRSSLE